jgi:hypothetical protein
VPAVLLVPLVVNLLLALLVPFSTFGLRGRLEAIEAQMDDIQHEIRSLAMRLPAPITEDLPPIRRVDRARSAGGARPACFAPAGHACRLVRFYLLPRLKRIHAQQLYRPIAGEPDAYPGVVLLLGGLCFNLGASWSACVERR